MASIKPFLFSCFPTCNFSNATTGLQTMWYWMMKQPPSPLLFVSPDRFSPPPHPLGVLSFHNKGHRLPLSHALTFLSMVVLTGSAGWAVPYNIHTSRGRQTDRQWELRCQIGLSRQMTSPPLLCSSREHLTCLWYKFFLRVDGRGIMLPPINAFEAVQNIQSCKDGNVICSLTSTS